MLKRLTTVCSSCPSFCPPSISQVGQSVSQEHHPAHWPVTLPWSRIRSSGGERAKPPDTTTLPPPPHRAAPPGECCCFGPPSHHPSTQRVPCPLPFLCCCWPARPRPVGPVPSLPSLPHQTSRPRCSPPRPILLPSSSALHSAPSQAVTNLSTLSSPGGKLAPPLLDTLLSSLGLSVCTSLLCVREAAAVCHRA